ncbi:MAG: folate-binding protein YgfZ [Gammaproteobacteria bacterium]|nr:folate-binding protein YgfZ [Gammaproteobacteria bacterium]MDH5652591.1 folate-binding protein YgfZ [Gammaproteobacteria bacterium]
MQASWQSHLQNNKAHIINDTVIDFGNPDQETAAANTTIIITDLSHYGLLQVSGTDAADFLQNQLSNDVRLVTPEASQLSAYCTPKGRILASFRLFHHADGYLMQMPRPVLTPTMNRLRMFVLRSQVSLTDRSDDLVQLGLAGEGSDKLLASCVGKIPAVVDGVCESDGLQIIRLPDNTHRYMVLGPAEKMIALWNKLAPSATPVGAAGWTQRDIHAGIPVIQPQTVDSFVPQMVNLHVINGVSFKKGCYPGQEIVARMQYLGKLKRRMYLAHVQSDATVNAGDELYSAGGNTQSVGKVVEAAPTAGGGYDLLAVIQIAELANGDVLLHDKQGAILEFRDLPYSVAE